MFKFYISSLTLLFLLSFSFIIHADNRSEFEQWLSNETTSFEEYRDKRDKEFTGFLNDQWKEMQTFQGLVRDKTPKPIKLPKAPVTKIDPSAVQTPITIDKKSKDKPVFVEPPVIVALPPVKTEVVKKVFKPVPALLKPDGKKITIDFYGQNLDFYYDPKLIVTLNKPFNQKNISNIWSSMSKADHEGMLKQISSHRKPLTLNDWSYILLVNKISQKLHPGNKNRQSLFTWYMMTKSGYKARIAYDRNFVYILMPSRQQLFEAPYFTFDKLRYYALSFDGVKQKPGRIYTYNGHYPGASKRLDMSLNTTLSTGRAQQSRYVNFNYQNKVYRIDVSYDSQTIKYLKTYPQMDISMYFNSQVSQATANPILNQLRPLVEGRTQLDAVNLLLRFVQTAFKYKTDQQQFGIENYLFPEETLHYPYSDCEDRSIFFAWLVHNLLGLDVIGLDFPGHIAAAVSFNEHIKGDFIKYNDKYYIVTDPTYVNAKAGMTMPAYKNKKPAVIRILN